MCLHAKCFNCGNMWHIKLACKAAFHLSASGDEPCSSDFVKSDVSIDHMSLSTILKGNFHTQKRLYISLILCHDVLFM